MRTILLRGAAAIALCAPFAAYAQTAPDPALDEGEVVVTGQRASQKKAIDAKREAIGVIDVAASDDIGRLPDRNVAEVVERLPGVGVTYDQGEGRFVSVRGVPSNLNGYTLNGFELGNPDGNTRSLPLDIVSGQLVNRVEIAKVKTADMDGQGIGGNINLVTQTAFDFRDRRTVLISGKAGKQQLNDKVPIQGDLSVAGRFGADDQFGIALGASYSHRDFNSDGFYPDNWKPDARFARGGVPDNIKFTEYSLDRKRYGATASLDWRPSTTQSFYARAIFSDFIEDEIRPRYRLDFTLTPFTVNPDGVTGTTPGVATPANGVGAGSGPERREDLRLDFKTKKLFAVMLGGASEFDRLKLDYSGGYNRNEVGDQFPIWQFRCNPGPVNFDFSNVIYTATPVTECTPAQLQFRQYTFSNQVGTEDIWQGRIDARYDLGDGNFVKAGFKYRDADRDFDQDNNVWGRGATNATRFTLGQFNLQAPDVFVRPDQNNTDRTYRNSPNIDPAAILAFTAANLPGPFFVYDAATSRANNTLGDFVLSETVTAGYALANWTSGAITVTPGVRYEHTRLAIAGATLQNGTTITPVSRRSSYDDFLPSVIVKIQPIRETIFRLAYSRSLGRPEYNSLSPGGTIDTVNLIVSSGNPDLKPYRADNLDATAEWYFAPGGLLSVGVFGKRIRNPIFTQSVTVQNAAYNGVTYPQLTFTQPLNADKGDIIGIEAQYQQQFTFLPGLLSGFGVQLTGTLTDSTLRLPNNRSSTFPAQSKYLYGAELFYQKGPVEASVAYHNTGYALLSAGTVAFQDQYNNDLRRLDAKASFRFDRFTVFFEAQNLTDEATRQYQGGNKDWIVQNERYGRTFYAGVSAKF